MHAGAYAQHPNGIMGIMGSVQSYCPSSSLHVALHACMHGHTALGCIRRLGSSRLSLVLASLECPRRSSDARYGSSLICLWCLHRTPCTHPHLPLAHSCRTHACPHAGNSWLHLFKMPLTFKLVLASTGINSVLMFLATVWCLVSSLIACSCANKGHRHGAHA